MRFWQRIFNRVPFTIAVSLLLLSSFPNLRFIELNADSTSQKLARKSGALGKAKGNEEASASLGNCTKSATVLTRTFQKQCAGIN
jgi:hypothetical protein